MNFHRVGTELKIDPISGNFEELKCGQINEVYGELSVCGSSRTELPEGLRVYEGLLMEDTKITALPNGLYVDGDIDATGSFDLKTIGEFVYITGDLIVENELEVPESSFIGGEILVQNDQELH